MLLDHATALYLAGLVDAVAVLARASLDIHVQRVFIHKGRVPGRSRRASRLRGRVCQIQDCNIIDRVTCGKFNQTIDTGDAEAHGRPVVAADVLAALVGLRAELERSQAQA